MYTMALRLMPVILFSSCTSSCGKGRVLNPTLGENDSHNLPNLPDFSANRTSGVAPLSVFFNAGDPGIELGSLDPFQVPMYVWSFDDPGSGTWPISGKSKTHALGAVAGHVFRTPGTYEVEVVISHGAGAKTKRVTIEVTDPATVYEGSKTTCVSTSGNFTGCPAGAKRVTTAEFDLDDGGVLSHLDAPNTRVLLRRGEVWAANEQSDLCGPGPRHLGAFGDGARPKVTSSFDDNFIELGCTRDLTKMDDWRITDLELDGESVGGRAFREQQVRNLLLDNLEVHHFTNQNINMDLFHSDDAGEGAEVPDGTFLVNLEVHHAGSVHNAYVGGTRLAILGCYFHSSGSHSLRIPYTERAVIQHNRITGANSGDHALKLSNEFASLEHGILTPDDPTRWFIVSDNLVEGDREQQTLAFAPQGNSQPFPENVTRGIIENNLIVGSSSTSLAMRINGNHLVVRNNIFDMPQGDGIEIKKRSKAQPLPDYNEIYNNTAIWRDSGSFTFVFLNEGDNPGDPYPNHTAIANNLIYAPNGASIVLVRDYGEDTGTVTVDEGNLDTGTTSSLVNATPQDAADFALNDNSPARDAGVEVPVKYDFRGWRRADGAIDIGAFEHGATP
jgi:hypothetical protein